MDGWTPHDGIGALKMPDLTIHDLTITDQVARVDNARPVDTDGPNDRGAKYKTCVLRVLKNPLVVTLYPLAVPASHLLSPFHGINFHVHLVSLANVFFIYFLIHLSTHFCHHHHSSVHRPFTLSLQAQNPPIQQILLALIHFWYPLD